jgi:GNAT superfamily N-acetyltransferase
VRVARLADHPHLLEELARDLEREWAEWYGPGGKGCAHADLMARANRDVLPLALVAHDGERAVGTLTISPADIYVHPGFSPSLIAFWVRNDLRNRGIGAQLLRAAYDEARRLKLTTLYASTSTAASLFRRELWREGERFAWDGSELTIFARDL